MPMAQDKKTYQTFFTLTDAYKSLFPNNAEVLMAGKRENNKTLTRSYNYIRNRINLDILVVAEDGKNYYFANNPEILETEAHSGRDNSVLWLIDLENYVGKLYPNSHKVIDYFKSISKPEIIGPLGRRICNYYKNTGKIYKNYLLARHLSDKGESCLSRLFY